MNKPGSLERQLEEIKQMQRRRAIRRVTLATVVILVLSVVLVVSQFGSIRRIWAAAQTAVAPLPTITKTPTVTLTFTITSTATATPTATFTSTLTPTSTSTFTPTPTLAPYLGIVTGKLYVREKPDDTSQVLGYLYENDPVSIIGVLGNTPDGWYQIIFGPRMGWVSQKYIGTNPSIPDAYRIEYP